MTNDGFCGSFVGFEAQCIPPPLPDRQIDAELMVFRHKKSGKMHTVDHRAKIESFYHYKESFLNNFQVSWEKVYFVTFVTEESAFNAESRGLYFLKSVNFVICFAFLVSKCFVMNIVIN